MKKGAIMNFDTLFEKIKLYITNKKELDLIKEAYLFADSKHKGQKRLSGEDYISHPLNVAYILTDIFADYETICAAILHDVIEDCDTSKEEISSIFGENIAILVDGVTMINSLSYVSGNEATMANHRKILVGLSEDVRVIIIKLADRLHNMRTLWVKPAEKQRKKAKETLDILIPIASRLGMNSVKGELEDLSLRYLKPDVYFFIVEKLNQTKRDRDLAVKEMMQIVSSQLNEQGIKHEIKGRAKSIYSIYKKLDKGRKFSDIYDLLALRIYLDKEPECYQTLGILHSHYKPIPKRFKDYIAMPKSNMYQSLHTTVFGVRGQLFEIQIRTYEMDKIAELGIASHWSYKEKGSQKANMQNAMEQKLQFFRSIIDLKSNETDDEEFVNSVKEDVFNDTIYVFTPKGDVVELPVESTPIDFAYKVHSKVGDKTVGAIVNGSIVSLDYELQNNDIIKINTSPLSSGPSKEWMNIAKTNQAKHKIKSFFNKEAKEVYLKLGEELLNKELRKRKISYNDFWTNANKDMILETLKEKSMEDLYINVGNSKHPAKAVLNIILKETDTKEDIILRRTANNKISKVHLKNDIIVQGLEDLKATLASCCNPVPGDDITGYITKGKGVSVHRDNCPNIRALNERLIAVSWNEDIDKKFPTTIKIEALENNNLLLDIISKTSNKSVNVITVNSKNNINTHTFEITLEVSNNELLDKFMLDIKEIPSVSRVERMIN